MQYCTLCWENWQWQLGWVPPSLWFKAGGLSPPLPKFSLDIVMYLLDKIHIICLKPIRSSLCSSVSQCQGYLSTFQRDPSSRSMYPSSPIVMQAQNCAGVHRSQVQLKEEAASFDVIQAQVWCLGVVLQMCLLLPLLWMTMLLCWWTVTYQTHQVPPLNNQVLQKKS